MDNKQLKIHANNIRKNIIEMVTEFINDENADISEISFQIIDYLNTRESNYLLAQNKLKNSMNAMKENNNIFRYIFFS